MYLRVSSVFQTTLLIKFTDNFLPRLSTLSDRRFWGEDGCQTFLLFGGLMLKVQTATPCSDFCVEECLQVTSHSSGSLHLSTLVTVSSFHCKCRSSTTIWKVTRSLATGLVTPISQLHLRKKESSEFILTSTSTKFTLGCSVFGKLSWSFYYRNISTMNCTYVMYAFKICGKDLPFSVSVRLGFLLTLKTFCGVNDYDNSQTKRLQWLTWVTTTCEQMALISGGIAFSNMLMKCSRLNNKYERLKMWTCLFQTNYYRQIVLEVTHVKASLYSPSCWVLSYSWLLCFCSSSLSLSHRLCGDVAQPPNASCFSLGLSFLHDSLVLSN